MRQEHSVLLSKIQAFVHGTNDICFLGLIGSASNTDTLYDDYSDIDLIVVVNNLPQYFENAEWLHSIDEVWMTFTESAPDLNHWERRCIFKNGIDVDFVLVDKTKLISDNNEFPVLKEICHTTLKVLFDNENIIRKFNSIISEEKELSFPDETEYNNTINDFYFHYLWTFKKCLRGEYWIALQCLNGYLKQRTLTMLEWYEHSLHGKNYDTFYNGRYLEKWVEKSLIDKLRETFSSYSKESIINALVANKKLFTNIAKETATKYGFTFPEIQEQKLSDWINNEYIANNKLPFSAT
ncbi:MAG: aminoglycoside 6-adenylyltransferase [Fibrobacter sp.]|nr:aminoglycoside 6-adenylyltransferase [Fibrobacter sp.]